MAEKCLEAALERFTAVNEKCKQKVDEKCKQKADEECKQKADQSLNSFELDRLKVELTQAQVYSPKEESKQTADQSEGERFFTPPPTPEKCKQTVDEPDKIEVLPPVHSLNETVSQIL